MRIDCSPHMALAVCGCGWRHAALDRAGATRAAADHLAHCGTGLPATAARYRARVSRETSRERDR